MRMSFVIINPKSTCGFSLKMVLKYVLVVLLAVAVFARSIEENQTGK